MSIGSLGGAQLGSASGGGQAYAAQGQSAQAPQFPTQQAGAAAPQTQMGGVMNYEMQQGQPPMQESMQPPTQQSQPPQNWQQPVQAVGGFDTTGFQYGFGPSGDIQNNVDNPGVNTQGFDPFNPNANFQTDAGLNTNYNPNAGLDTSRIDAARMPVSSVNSGQEYYDRMQNAFYQQGESRLKPRMQEEQAALETQLQNQGLTRGSAAWNAEMDRQMRARNDAYSSLTNNAIMASGQEAARMQGMDINAGNFANAAAQQNFMNQGQAQNWFNQANQQNWQNQFDSQNAGNQALQNQFLNQQGAQILSNQAGQQFFDNQLSGQRAQNDAFGQQFGQNLAQQNFRNAAQQQNFQQGLDRARLNNDAWGQNEQLRNQRDISNNSLQAAYSNAAAQQALGQGQLDLQRRGMDFDQARQMMFDPYVLQNLQMQGMFPQGGPNFNSFAMAGQGAPGNFTSGARDQFNINQANNQNLFGKVGSLGGNFMGRP